MYTKEDQKQKEDEGMYWLGFSVFPGIGPKRFRLLLNYFKSAKAAWEANVLDLEPILGKVLTAKLNEFKRNFILEKYYNELQAKKVSFIRLIDKDYPKLLKQIEDPPFLLYIKGSIPIYSSNEVSDNERTIQKIVAVVGTRKITSYGKDVTEQITKELVSAGFTIVSGLAFGVDACAHKITMESKGKTIAVLGCGVDCCSPRENFYLYKQIIESGGCIISEYPLNKEPTKGSFPSRNRIIAGLSQAVIVTEGASDSGALYTANDALELKRPVFAVPGPITSQLSKGPHSLISKGAKLVTSAEDILKELMANGEGQIVSNKKEIKGDNKEEQTIIDLLVNEQLHFDELIRKAKIESSRLGTLLSIMEMKGFLRSTNGFYRLM